MIRRIPLPVSAPCKFAYDYWRSKCSDDYFPTRKDIVPNEIKRILPYVSMIDVVDHGKDFRVRLIGSEMQRYLGRNCTDEFISMDMGFKRKLYEPWFRSLLSKKSVLIGTINSGDEDTELAFDRELISMPLMNAEQSEVILILNVMVRTNHWSKHVPEFVKPASETFHKN